MKRNKYKMPTKSDLKGRISTISNAFAISVTPFIRPTEEELATYYPLLGIKEGQCAYSLGVGNGKELRVECKIRRVALLETLNNQGFATDSIRSLWAKYNQSKLDDG